MPDLDLENKSAERLLVNLLKTFLLVTLLVVAISAGG